MFKAAQNKTDDPPQGGAYAASNPIFSPLLAQTLKGSFRVNHDQPVVKKLDIGDAAAFLQMHTETRMSLPEDQRKFMKELNPDLLTHLLKNGMPVIGVFVGGKLVSGCAILYPSDKAVAEYLADYDFNGEVDKTAVISAVWTNPAHTGKGLSKTAVEQGMNFAVLEGKEIFRAKVDKQNGASLGLFEHFTFDTTPEGQNPEKVYPILAL